MQGSGNQVQITSRTFPAEDLRRAATAVAENTSVGEVAAWIGIGRTTLRNFIVNFTTPHPRNLRKIAVWYNTVGKTAAAELESSAHPRVGTVADVDERACEALLWAIPAEQRGAAVDIMSEARKNLGARARPGAGRCRALVLSPAKEAAPNGRSPGAPRDGCRGT